MTTSTTDAISSRATASDAARWGQLIFGIICMVMIANLQYGWTLFVNPIDQKYHWGRAAIQVAFTIFVLTETWLVPFEGYLIDRFGPRVMVCGSGVLVVTVSSISQSCSCSLSDVGPRHLPAGTPRFPHRRLTALFLVRIPPGIAGAGKEGLVERVPSRRSLELPHSPLHKPLPG